jgi:hypothetical protein
MGESERTGVDSNLMPECGPPARCPICGGKISNPLDQPTNASLEGLCGSHNHTLGSSGVAGLSGI